jgi:hypothetical protein
VYTTLRAAILAAKSAPVASEKAFAIAVIASPAVTPWVGPNKHFLKVIVHLQPVDTRSKVEVNETAVSITGVMAPFTQLVSALHAIADDADIQVPPLAVHAYGEHVAAVLTHSLFVVS